MSEDGTVFVGQGTNPDGFAEGWMAVVPLPVVPVPGLTRYGLGALALVLAFGAYLMRKERFAPGEI